MNRITRTVLGSGALAGLATMAPLSMDPGAAMSGKAPVRLTAACGQATSCMPYTSYVCSTFHQDYQNMKCATGCGS